jgi:hypothetical protein
MTSLSGEGTILKTDAQGRVRTPPQRRETLLDEFERSGLSGTKFAQLSGVKYQTFAAWAARRRKQRGQTAPPTQAVDSVRWLEAVVGDARAPASTPAVVNVRLPNGVWLEVADLHQVRLAVALVQALARPATAC